MVEKQRTTEAVINVRFKKGKQSHNARTMLIIKVTALCFVYLVEAHLSNGLPSISITRRHRGDIFSPQGERFHKELCVSLSGGTAGPSEDDQPECRCDQRLPVFRDDLNVCVNDIQECAVAPFVSGTIAKKIPYVFLPLKGQIVYPSAEILVSDDNGAPVCVVSGGQFLGRKGWLNLRNNSDTEPPFRLFRDEGRTYLQWFGETSLRTAMEGRIILVHLMCKDASASAPESKIFTPCVAFRVAGNPSVKEVTFATDVKLATEPNSGLTTREYVAIGLCSLFLAVFYVASIFLYLHWRKQKQTKSKKKEINETAHLTLGEEGIVKNNPLLQASRRVGVCGEDNAGYISDSNSCCSDSEQISDLLRLDEDDSVTRQNLQTSAVVHPCDLGYGETVLNQDLNSIERLPEENVSIVETLEGKEMHPETIKAIASASGRRKLYFNPAYFEPELLKAPPQAALEFLIKIREVIAIAKHKMSSKKFSPSLLGIPEEDGSSKAESHSTRKEGPPHLQRNEIVFSSHLKAAVQTVRTTSRDSSEVATNDFCCPSDAKQKIIEKWLEDVPVMMTASVTDPKPNCEKKNSEEDKLLKNRNSWSANELIDREILGEAKKRNERNRDDEMATRHGKRRPSTKNRPPPHPPQQVFPIPNNINITGNIEANKTETKNDSKDISRGQADPGRISPCWPSHISSPPPSCGYRNENVRPHENSQSVTNPTKNLMDAVIQELTSFKNNDRQLGSKKEKCFESLGGGALKSSESNEISLHQCMGVNCPTGRRDEPTNEIPEDVAKPTTTTVSSTCSTFTVSNCNIHGNKNNFRQDKLSQVFGAEKAEEQREGGREMERINGAQDEHEYEIILLNDQAELEKENGSPAKIFQPFFATGESPKYERHEGYSLVSEVYVNDSCAGDSPTEAFFTSKIPDGKIRYEVTDEKTSRLTIQVKDTSGRNKNFLNESDHFEPDTLERKQSKAKAIQEDDNGGEIIENRNFCESKPRSKGVSENSESSENFTDSLERPTVLLKTNGSFKRNSLENDVNELFRTLNWARMDNFGSLREIYEAKNRHHRKRTETTSLIDGANSDTDCVSTLSWSEVRRNKLLHRGIVLHIAEDATKKFKETQLQNEKSSQYNSESRSRFHLRSPISQPSNDRERRKFRTPSSPPPLHRSFPLSPHAFQSRLPGSLDKSPVNLADGGKSNHSSSDASFPDDLAGKINTVVKVSASTERGFQCPDANARSGSPLLKNTPPRPPKNSAISSPPLPPRISKPPLPPKNARNTKIKSNKFATRPLPPLPFSRKSKPVNSCSPVASGLSMDSYNSSDYESFYTLPYEEEEKEFNSVFKEPKASVVYFGKSEEAKWLSAPKGTVNGVQKFSIGHHDRPLTMQSAGKPLKRECRLKSTSHKVEDSGYLSTDSSEAYCPKDLLMSHIPEIPERTESFVGPYSETEESVCDGTSESGAESTATDSFYYGNFDETDPIINASENMNSPSHSYSLRLSDVEVNSDTERHCMPIMVRP